jgi:hypothetical protein
VDPIVPFFGDDRFGEPTRCGACPSQRARPRWMEEFPDTRIGDVFICAYAKKQS